MKTKKRKKESGEQRSPEGVDRAHGLYSYYFAAVATEQRSLFTLLNRFATDKKPS